MARDDPEAKPELTIGELASMTRLTVRALRHYDNIGLLHPARVDPNNGYRYYDTGQIESASTIAVLRGLDIDVETIGHLLDGTRQFGEVLAAERDRRERDARRAAASLAVLESLDARHGPDLAHIADTPPATLLGRSIRVLAADDVEASSAAFDKLFSAATSSNIDHHPDGTCIVRGTTREQLHLDVCIRPLSPDFAPLPGYRSITIDGGPTATMVHRGPLESLPLAHARLHRWILDNGTQSSGCARETYVGDLVDQVTRLDIPVG